MWYIYIIINSPEIKKKKKENFTVTNDEFLFFKPEWSKW